MPGTDGVIFTNNPARIPNIPICFLMKTGKVLSNLLVTKLSDSYYSFRSGCLWMTTWFPWCLSFTKMRQNRNKHQSVIQKVLITNLRTVMYYSSNKRHRTLWLTAQPLSSFISNTKLCFVFSPPPNIRTQNDPHRRYYRCSVSELLWEELKPCTLPFHLWAKLQMI